MKTRTILFYTTLALALVAGCVPEKRVTWSPDGRWAAVVGGNGLALCDETGKLSDAVLEYRRVAWMKDSRTLVAAGPRSIGAWAELSKALPPQRIEEIIAFAKRLRDEVLQYQGTWEAFGDRPIVRDADPRLLVASLLYFRDVQPEGLREKLGEEWKSVDEAQVDVWSIQVLKVSDKGQLDPGGAPLAVDVGEVFSVQISPDNGMLSFVAAATSGDKLPVLYVLPLAAGAAPLPVAENVSQYPDWSPDGQSLVFSRTAHSSDSNTDSLTLGTITRRQVRDASGALISPLPEAQDLAGMLFTPFTTVRWLKDGRILFVAAPVTLPTTTSDLPQHPALFAMDPARQATITRLSPQWAEPYFDDCAALYSVSPDETRVLLPSQNGTAAVMEIATGEVEAIAYNNEAQQKTEVIPTWRNNDQVSLAAIPPTGQSGRSELVLWTLGKPDAARILSAAWPADFVEDFLVKPDEGNAGEAASQP